MPSKESSSSSAWRWRSSSRFVSSPLRIVARAFLSNFAGRAARVGLDGGLAGRCAAEELDLTVGFDTLRRAGGFLAAVFFAVVLGVFLGAAFLAAPPVLDEAVFLAVFFDAAALAAGFFADAFLAALFGEVFFGVGFLAAVMGAGR